MSDILQSEVLLVIIIIICFRSIINIYLNKHKIIKFSTIRSTIYMTILYQSSQVKQYAIKNILLKCFMEIKKRGAINLFGFKRVSLKVNLME